MATVSPSHAIDWGTTRIAYALTRSARQKTLSIRVEPDGRVEVVAPPSIEEAAIGLAVTKKAAWIVERLRANEDVPPAPTAREFVSGEGFTYLGRQYRLRVAMHDALAGETTDAQEGVVRLVGRHLIVTVPPLRASDERAAYVRSALIAWYRSHAAERFEARVQLWAPQVGVTPTAVLVREPQKRWGSCDASGKLRLNWRIIQAPGTLVDYVVVHELAHLLHDDHGPRFWALVGRVLPDYEERRSALRIAGRSLIW